MGNLVIFPHDDILQLSHGHLAERVVTYATRQWRSNPEHETDFLSENYGNNAETYTDRSYSNAVLLFCLLFAFRTQWGNSAESEKSSGGLKTLDYIIAR